MSDDRKHPEATGGGGLKADDESTRPQRGGEAATTRFGMEEGDNTDIPATGSAADDDEASAHPS